MPASGLSGARSAGLLMAKFTDGTTFTSANVVASLNRVKDPKTADAASSFIASVTKIVPDGTYAVKLLLSHPDASVTS